MIVIKDRNNILTYTAGTSATQFNLQNSQLAEFVLGGGQFTFNKQVKVSGDLYFNGKLYVHESEGTFGAYQFLASDENRNTVWKDLQTAQISDWSSSWDAKYNAIVKNTAFNKDFGTTEGTVAEGNHTHTFASITNKPTTLAGYGITDQLVYQESFDTILGNYWNTRFNNSYASKVNVSTNYLPMMNSQGVLINSPIRNDSIFGLFSTSFYVSGQITTKDLRINGSLLTALSPQGGEVGDVLISNGYGSTFGFAPKWRKLVASDISDYTESWLIQMNEYNASNPINFNIVETDDLNGERHSYGLKLLNRDGVEQSRVVYNSETGLTGFETSHFDESDNTFKALNVIGSDGYLYSVIGDTERRYAFIDEVTQGSGSVGTLQQVSALGANSTIRLQFNGVNYATVNDISTYTLPTLQQVSGQGANSTIRLQYDGVNYATVNDIPNTPNLQNVMSVLNSTNLDVIFKPDVALNHKGIQFLNQDGTTLGSEIRQEGNNSLKISALNSVKIDAALISFANVVDLFLAPNYSFNFLPTTAVSNGARYAFEWDNSVGGGFFKLVKIN